MKKRLLSLFVCLCVILTLSHTALAATLANFNAKRTFTEATFSDIKATDWYYKNVSVCYELSLLDGHDGKYNPSGSITVAEALKLAANLRSVYETGESLTQGDGVWYQAFVDYCIKNEIIKSGDYADYTSRATRADFVKILAAALPDEATTPVNEVEDGRIPDVAERFSYGEAVYKFYRAGILTGGGANGEFYPNQPVSRAEAAAILARIVRPEQRAMTQKVSTLTPEEIYARCADAVFFIEVLNKEGDVIKTGSAFFISADGLAVTNCHVIADATSARVKLANGETREIEGIYDFSLATDCALIQVKGGGFSTLTIANYTPATGAEVYTIGNPIGLINTFSRGIVSTANRVLETGERYIQIDAPISHGSSGGALLDAQGRVIGITSAGFTQGQNLNLAVPIGDIDALSTEKVYALGKYPSEHEFFEGYFPVPDFGAYFNIALDYEDEFYGMQTYVYTLSNESVAKTLKEYRELLEEYGFTPYSAVASDEDGNPMLYFHPMFGHVVEFDLDEGYFNTTFELTVY